MRTLPRITSRPTTGRYSSHQPLVWLLAALLAYGCRDPVVADVSRRVATVHAQVHAAPVPGEYWEVTDLSVGAPATLTRAVAINDAGVIVGYGTVGGVKVALRWSNGTAAILKMPARFSSARATDINNRGFVVGLVSTDSATWGFFRDTAGSVTVLPNTKSDTANWVSALNDSNIVVGYAYDAKRAISWRKIGTGWVATDLGTVGGFSGAIAEDINNSGAIVGTAYQGAMRRAFIKPAGQAMQLLPGFGSSSYGRSINALGDMAGTALRLGGEPRYVLWPAAGGMIDATHAASTSGEASLSDLSRLAGWTDASGSSRAFTLLNGIYTILPLPPGGVTSVAYGINRCGVIVGAVTTMGGSYRAARWRRAVGNPPMYLCG
jgi:uncharacterized membrane protein